MAPGNVSLSVLVATLLLCACFGPEDTGKQGIESTGSQTPASNYTQPGPDLTGQNGTLPADNGTQANATAEEYAPPSLVLEEYDGGFFSIKKPKGWKLVTAGSCETFAVMVYNESNPMDMLFYFGELGPFYTNEYQRELDQYYMDMGGFPIEWIDAPVIYPLTPGNFLKEYHELLGMELAERFMSSWPQINDVEIISSESDQAIVPGGNGATMRALFTSDDELGEGLFFTSVAEVLPSMGSPGSGLSYAFSFTGVMAGKDNFRHFEPYLLECLKGMSLSQSYVSNCLKLQQQFTQAALEAGKTMGEIGDIIHDSWEYRNKVDDAVAEKRSDAILGRERVYNPDTGEVYTVDDGFYDNYDLHRNGYEMSNLQALPDGDYDLWALPALDGAQHIH